MSIFIKLNFKNNRRCLININRVSNVKNKSVTLATKNDMFLWEDNALYKIDKRKYSFNLVYKSKLSPLAIECKEFIKRIRSKSKPYTDDTGLKVVSVLSKLRN